MSMILNKFKPKQVTEGAGVELNRVFGYYETKEFDPFLMLDYFDVHIDPDETYQTPGFPWHPHKGMETISYFLRGGGQHQDSMGNKGIISQGELQWMSAGRGIFHQEMPLAAPDGIQGFQFWVNLPASRKLKKPEYQYIKKGQMKSLKSLGAEVKVISGSYKDIQGPIDKNDTFINED
jgi:redox-sensitive bicupin YhaK (pirin superfamily)